MNVDRVAQAMTSGAPGRGFTARVMAPIEGRPSPGLTARVMTGLDAPDAPRRRALLRPAMALAAVVAAAAGALALIQPGVEMPAAPDAPRLATNGGPRVPARPTAFTITTSVVRRAPRTAQAPVVVAVLVAPPEPLTIHQIAALDTPDRISLSAIEAAACTIPALGSPAPLRVIDLPGNAGGSRNEFKEKP